MSILPEIRCDRALSVGIFGPIVRFTNLVDSNRLPILMYHSVSEWGPSFKSSFYQIHTPARVFRSQIEGLVQDGYKVIGLQEGLNILYKGKAPERSVVLTFDDAYRDFLENAWPVLQEFGFTATVFVPTSMVGKTNKRLHGKKCLSWEELGDLAENGIEIGSHSEGHRELAKLSRKELISEIGGSKKEIERRIGKEVITFSYPYAFPEWDKSFAAISEKILNENGYRWGVTTSTGRASPKNSNYRIPRIPVNGADDRSFFSSKVIGAYDWFSFPQSVFKGIKYFSRKGSRTENG